MVRVCHIISGDLWAGAEVMACSLLRGLRAYPDLDLSVLLLNEGRLAEELRSAGLSVQVLDESRLSFPLLLREARAYLWEKSPQIIHSHRYKENILAFIASRTGGGAHLIATQHGMPEPASSQPSLAGRLVARLNRHLLVNHFDRVVGVSHDIRSNFLNKLGFNSQRVSVIHNGIKLPEPLPRGKSCLAVVGSAGRLFPVKDYPLMVEIARVATARSASLHFELAGEGPERGQLEERISACGLGGTFRLRGQLENMAAFYQGLDVYLNTSLHEGIPMSILEAMGHGLPVVAPKVGGICEIIEDGTEGFLVAGRNPEDFAEKCLLLQDADLRQRMGQAAREKVQRVFSVENMALQYWELYRNLAG